jgi:hypothetical protein
VIKCLLEHMAEPNFGQDCKAELETREEMMKSDYRYDGGVATGCKSDIQALCAEQASQLRGNATVLKCLVENFKQTGESCQMELSRAVRLALWNFKAGAGLTDVCDNDVAQQCPKVREGCMCFLTLRAAWCAPRSLACACWSWAELHPAPNAPAVEWAGQAVAAACYSLLAAQEHGMVQSGQLLFDSVHGPRG